MTELLDADGVEVVHGEEAASEAAGDGGLAAPTMHHEQDEDANDAGDDEDDGPGDSKGLFGKARSLLFGKADWSYEEGPEGGDRWVNGEGDVRYRRPAGAEPAPDDEPDGDATAASDLSEGDEVLIDGAECEVDRVSDMGGGFYVAGRDGDDEVHTARVGPDEAFEAPDPSDDVEVLGREAGVEDPSELARVWDEGWDETEEGRGVLDEADVNAAGFARMVADKEEEFSGLADTTAAVGLVVEDLKGEANSENDEGPSDELLEATAGSRDGIKDVIGDYTEPYSGGSASEGDRVVKPDFDPQSGEWSARVGTVTEMRENSRGDAAVDIEFDDGGAEEWSRPNDFRALDASDTDDGAPDDGPDDAGRPDVSEALEGVDESDPGAVADAIGVDPSNRTEFRELADEEQYRLEDGLREAYGDTEVREVYDRIGEWKEWSDGDAGHFLETGFDRTGDGLWGESFRDGGAEPSPEQVRALEVMREVSTDFIREEYGDEVEVHRGISEEAWEAYDESEDYPLEMSSMAVMSTERDVAGSFADGNGTATITMTVPAEEVVFAMDATTDAVTGGGREGELQIMGGPRSPDEVDPA